MTKYQITEEQQKILLQLAVYSRQVRSKEAGVARARASLDDLIVDARKQGISVNQIAKAVGLSSTRVSQIEKERA